MNTKSTYFGSLTPGECKHNIEFEYTDEQEKELQQAKKKAVEAVDLLKQIDELRVKALELVPVPHSCYTKSQREKEKTLLKVMDRLFSLTKRSSDIDSRIRYEKERESKIELEKIQKENEFKQQQARNDLITRAIQFLQKRNIQVGVDYALDMVIDVAYNVAFDEEVEKLKTSGGMFEFSGDDSCEDCAGWNGVDHRCSCGNRRVSWTSDGDFEHLIVYAEAY